MKKKIIVLSCFWALVCSLGLPAQGNDHSQTIYYHWEERNQLLLWIGDYENRITATLEEGKWAWSPKDIENKPDWIEILKERTPSGYKEEYEKDLAKSGELLIGFLNYILEKQPYNAKVRSPESYIYFYLKKLNDKETVDIVFASAEGSPGFYFEKKDKLWEKPGIINVTEFFQLPDTNSFKNIFEKDFPEIFNNKLSVFWNSLIEEFLKIKDPRCYYYKTKAGKDRVLLVEQIDRRGFIELHRPLPVKVEKEKIQTGIIKKEKGFKVLLSRYWHTLILSILLVFVLSLLVYKTIRSKTLNADNLKSRIKDFLSKDELYLKDLETLSERKKKLGKKVDDIIEIFDSLDKIIELGKAAKVHYDRFETTDEKKTPTKWIEDEFRKLDLNSKTISDLENSMKKIEAENKKVVNEMAEMIKKEDIPETGKKTGADKKEGVVSQSKKLSVFSKLIKYFKRSKKENKDKNENHKSNDDNLTEKWQSIKKLINELKKFKEFEEENNRIAKEMSEKYQAKGEDLTSKWQFIVHLINEKDKTIETKEGEIEQIKGVHEDVSKKFDAEKMQRQNIINDCKKIDSLNDTLLNGQREILEYSPGQEPEIAVMISFLIYYSLYHLKQAFIDGNELRQGIMLHNLEKISDSLKEKHQVFGNKTFKAFEIGYDKIFHDFPVSRDIEIVASEERHDSDRIFQSILRRLRDLSEQRLNFRPFYFAVDKQEKVHKAM